MIHTRVFIIIVTFDRLFEKKRTFRVDFILSLVRGGHLGAQVRRHPPAGPGRWSRRMNNSVDDPNYQRCSCLIFEYRDCALGVVRERL